MAPAWANYLDCYLPACSVCIRQELDVANHCRDIQTFLEAIRMLRRGASGPSVRGYWSLQAGILEGM